MRVKQKKTYIIIGLCLLVLLMSVGYAAFSTMLNINGTAEITTSWDVEITNVEFVSKVGDASYESPTYTYDTANLVSSFIYPGDSITYRITVSNLGSVNAVIDSAKLELEDQDVLIHKIEGLESGEILNAGADKTFTVTITFNEAVTSQPSISGVEASLKLHYLQAGNSTAFSDVTSSVSDSITINSLNLTPSETSIKAKINSSIPAYRYYYSIDGDVWYESVSDEYTINDLKPNTSYTVYVKAEDSSGEIVTTSGNTLTTDVTNPKVNINIANFELLEKDTVNHTNYDYYKILNFTVTATDNDKVDNVKYCTGASNCTASTNLTLNNDSANVEMPSASNAQYLCVEATDRVGNTFRKCTDEYKVDGTLPNLTDMTYSSSGNTVTINVTGTDSHSGIYKYMYSKDGGLTFVKANDDNYTFTNLEDGSYIFVSKIIDNAGNESASLNQPVTVRASNICGNTITNLANCVIANESGLTTDDENATASKAAILAKSTNQATTPNFTMASPSIIYGEKWATNTSTATYTSYVRMATAYTFNSSTGYFNLTSSTLIDPTTVDAVNTTYYTCGSTSTSCTTVYKLAANVTLSGNTYTFTKYNGTAEISNYDTTTPGTGMYAATDYDGKTSYYFRGTGVGNYVKFANKYWRIIRVNGDGTVRMIYDGTSKHLDGESSTDRRVTTKAFNSWWSDNAYLGYMHGSTSGNVITEATSPRTISNLSSTANYYFGTSYTYDPSTNKFTIEGTLVQDTITGYNEHGRSDLYTCFSVNNPSQSNGKCAEVWKVKDYVSPTSMNVEYEYTYNHTGLSTTAKYYFADSYTFNSSNNTFTLSGTKIQKKLSEYQSGNYNNLYTCWSEDVNGTCQRLEKVRRISAATTAVVRPVEWSSTSYSSAHTNTEPSTIKDYLENTWYPANLTGYTSKLSGKSVFCNNREISTYHDNTYTNEGYGSHPTMYGYPRFWVWSGSSISPTLACPRADDKFTVSNETGNGLLTAPVGLITADEVSMAGGRTGTQNNMYYLYTGHVYWTMSPSSFSSSASAAEMYVTESGVLSSDNVSGGYGVRPVINLNPENLTFTGDGTYEHPYEVS